MLAMALMYLNISMRTLGFILDNFTLLANVSAEFMIFLWFIVACI